jgi:hypothetical protein
MTAQDDLVIRSYRVGDELGLVELFSRSFGRTITPEHWRWKLHRPIDATQNVWVALCGDVPIFQYAGIPYRFECSGNEQRMIVAVDAMTAPEFRRRGLLTRVVSQAHDTWRSQGIAFVIGLPNQQWGSRTTALGWQVLFPLQWLVRPLRPEALLARRLRLPQLRRATLIGALWNRHWSGRLRLDDRIDMESVSSADESFDEIWRDCGKDWLYSTVRDRAWVHWRFFSRPATAYDVIVARRRGSPCGYAAYRIIRREGQVTAQLAELTAGRADAGTQDALLAEVIDKSLTGSAESIATLAVPGTENYVRLKRNGFIPRHAFSVEWVPLDPGLPLDAMRNSTNWNLSGADFDVI